MTHATLRLCAAVFILTLYSSFLAAQDVRVRFSSLSSVSSQEALGDLQTKLQVGTHLLAVDEEAIASVLTARPPQVALELPAEIPLPSVIVLEPFQIFTPNARTVVRDERGEREVPFRQQWASYKGKIPGNDRAIVVVNFSRFGMSGFFSVGGRRYMLESGSVSNGIRTHRFFEADPVLFQGRLNCGVQSPGDPAIDARVREIRSRHLNEAEVQLKRAETTPVPTQKLLTPDMYLGAVSSDTIEVHVALEGDNDLLLTNGNNVDSAMATMTATAAYASALYLNEAQVKIMVPFVRVWETSDPYPQDMFLALSTFTSYWNMDSAAQTVDRTIAHLFVSSGQWAVPTGVAGIAHLNTLCNRLEGYGVTDVKDSASVDQLITFAHEVGHNFGAHHTHSCLWPGGPFEICSEVEGSCYDGPVNGTEGTIMSYCSQRIAEFGPVVSALIRRNAEVAWCAPSTMQLPVAAADSSFLQSLYTTTGGATWTRNMNWAGPVAGRFGVAVRGGRVVAIDLAANNLDGALPSGLENLTELRRLNLSGRNHHRVSQVDPPNPPTDVFNMNYLTGQLPANINLLNKLEHLDLSNNQLNGSIPSGIGSLTELRWLNLSENQFNGAIPTTLGNLDSLELLDVSRNPMTGGIPTELGSLTNLRFLILTDMGLLGGTIPASLGSLSKLRAFIAYKLSLTGSIPVELSNLSQLSDLDLGTNQLTGSIPAELGNLGALENLFLLDNQLTGSLPASLGQLDKLVGLVLSNNMLSGSIPAEIGNMNVWKLILGKNQLTGEIPASFANLTQVVEFDVSENQLTGTLPEEFKNIGSEFYPGLGGVFEFTVHDNNLTGPFPDWLGTESHYNTLSTLKLGGNQFDVATVPAWIASKQFLNRLWLHSLGFTGSLPEEIGLLPYLYELKLSGNNFESMPNLNNVSLKQPGAFTAIEGNKLTFDDIVSILEYELQNLTYIPQQLLGEPINMDVEPGGQVAMTVQAGGEGNTYQWLKNGQEINGATDTAYTINSMAIADTGVYIAEVKNSAVPLLTLVRHPYKISLYTEGFPHTISLLLPASGSTELTNPVTLSWNADSLSDTYQVHVDTSQSFNSTLLIDSAAVTDTTVQLAALTRIGPYYWRVRGTNGLGQGNWSETRSFSMSSIVSVEGISDVPVEFALLQNYPNPFNPRTNFEVHVAQGGLVRLTVYDLLGREVATLINRDLQPGSYHISWDASGLTSGIYLYRMTAGSFTETRKLFLVK